MNVAHSPLGVRWSTLALVAVFLALGFTRVGPKRAVLGVAAWLLGFEVAWQFTTVVVHHADPATMATAGLHLIAGGLGWALAAHYAGLRVNRAAAIATAVIWVAWIVSGFQSLDQGSALGEALNEAAKTAWGLAYLLPLLQDALMRTLRSGAAPRSLTLFGRWLG